MSKVSKALKTIAVAAVCFAAPASLQADDHGKPGVQFYPKAEIDAGIFKRDGVIHEKEMINGKPWKAEDLSIFTSGDKSVDMGFYKATANRSEIESYSVDELMIFLKGGVDLIDADGTVTKVRAGDAVFINKGWKGVWDTKGYEKIYIIYNTK